MHGGENLSVNEQSAILSSTIYHKKSANCSAIVIISWYYANILQRTNLVNNVYTFSTEINYPVEGPTYIFEKEVGQNVLKKTFLKKPSVRSEPRIAGLGSNVL